MRRHAAGDTLALEAAKKMGPDMNIIIFELTLPRRNIIVEEDQDNLKKHVEAFSWVRSENAFSSRLILLVRRREGDTRGVLRELSLPPLPTQPKPQQMHATFSLYISRTTSASRPCALLHTYLWHTSHQ